MRDGTLATTMDVRVQSSNLLKKQKELITVQVELHTYIKSASHFIIWPLPAKMPDREIFLLH